MNKFADCRNCTYFCGEEPPVSDGTSHSVAHFLYNLTFYFFIINILHQMKKFFTIASVIAIAMQAWGADGTKSDPIPLTEGTIDVDFGTATSKYFTYTPSTEQMLTFSDLTNVNIYGFQITSEGKLYTESFNGTTYVQTQTGIPYLIEVTKGFSNSASSFTAGMYDCAWPDGDDWNHPIVPFDRFTYIPITASLPSYLKYTATNDGMLEMKFSAYITLSYSDSQNGTFSVVPTSYVSGGGYRGTMMVTAGQTYYFIIEAPSSPLCSFEIIDVEIGKSPDFPYNLENGSAGTFPKEEGKYYYLITSDPEASMLQITGNATFDGTAQLGDSFSYFTDSSDNRISIRTAVSQYNAQYYLVLTRDTPAASDQTFNVTFTSESYDSFPGQEITEGETTTPDAPGMFYYTFTVPTDGRKIVQISPVSEASGSSVSIYYADNKYTALAKGTSIEYEAVAGRQYTIAWDVAQNDTPLTFNLGFAAPSKGESADNPIPAHIGENSASGGSAVYFRYYATVDGWLVVKPASGLKMPAISMLPIPSDPYMQACDVLPYGDGAYRVATEKDRGYLIIFFGNQDINFSLSEITALEGEAASNPFVMTGDTADIPSEPAVYWFSYTAQRDGKLVVSTDIPFQQSVNHQDYTYVQLYAPEDPDNRITQLKPDYDLGIFDDKVIDTTAGTRYLIKVRTLVASDNRWVKCIVRDPIAGEIPELPIEIPFDGQSTTYEFSRMVNSETDAIWYGITLPEGYFTLKGNSGGVFNLTLFSSDNTQAPLATTEVLDLDYDEINEMYIYLWGIADFHISTPGKYLLCLSDNEVPFTADIDMSKSGIETAVNNGLTITPVPGAVVLKSSAPTTTNIFTIDGKLIYNAQVTEETTVTLPAGMYIVRLADRAAKVIIK